jgi:non-ribosomal peptide synthetase component F
VGQPIQLPPTPACRYRDFAHWQRARLAGDWGKTQAEAWRQRLLRPEPAPPLQLPADGPRSTGLDRPCARVPFALAGESGKRWLAAVGPERRGAVLLAAVQTLLYVDSGQCDLVVGLPVAGRERPELQEQVGLHLNMLPLRHRLDPAQPLSVLAAQDANVLADALARADYPFARLVADLGLAAPAGRHPVFDTMLIFHQHAVPRLDLPGVDAAPAAALPACARFDLDVEVWANADGLAGFIEYDAGLFSAARAAGFAAHLQAILAALAENPEQTPEALRTALTGVSAQDEANRFLADSLALDEDF